MLLSVLLSVLAAGAVHASARTPVVVELFTSEGCSSCPPADALLERLVAEQPVASAEIIGLELHVDYWDRQGWKDPFSSALFTRRQTEYGRALSVDDIYTPQAVVDGAAQMAGTEGDALARAITEAAARSHLPVRITAAAAAGFVRVSIDVPPAPADAEPMDVMFALAERGLSSNVSRGENSGRTLTHGAVVRRLESAGVAQSNGFVLAGEWKLNPQWNRERIVAVAWLQGRRTRHVYGAASAPVR